MTGPEPVPRGMGPVGRRCCRLLLVLFPPNLRKRLGEEWIPFLEEQRREARYQKPLLGPVVFWWDVLADVLTSSIRARGDGRREAARHPVKGGPLRPSGKERLMLGSFHRDIRFAVRTLSRRPFFTAVAALTLGLGIGSATAMYSVVDGVLLADVPYRDPDQLVSIWQTVEGRAGFTAAGEVRLQYSQYRALYQESTVLEQVALYASDWGESALSRGRRPEPVMVGAATASLLPVLGIQPVLGRWFLPEEEGDGAGARAMVTVLSHDTWVRQYGQDPDILGRAVVLNGRAYEVVGVLPPGFRMQWLSKSLVGSDDPGARDFWVPVGSPDWGVSPGSTMWEAVGRLAPEVSPQQARAETAMILAESWDRSTGAILSPRSSEETRGLSSPLFLLLGATGLLLLVACGNVAVLYLGEMSGREQEMATRTAVGASRPRMVQQLITEGVVLGLLGSLIGAIVAVGAARAFLALAPPMPRIEQVHLHLGVFGLAALIGVLSGLMFGAAPGVLFARESVASALRSVGRGGSRNPSGLGRVLMTGEFALTVALLVGGGLLARSFLRLMEVDPGFSSEGVVGVHVSLYTERYPWRDEAVSRFMNAVRAEMEAIPSVTAASAVNQLPFPGRVSTWGVRLNPSEHSTLMPKGYHIAPGYLSVLGIPILEGRGIEASDDLSSPSVVVVSESLARAIWGERSPLGQELLYPVGRLQVVGVAADVRQTAMQAPAPLTFYVPFAQHNTPDLTFVARIRGDPMEVIPSLREAVWRVDGDLAITSTGTMDAAIARSTRDERYRTFLFGTFAALATLIAAVGIMGVTARQVARSARELCIRKALGASQRSLVAVVLKMAAYTGGIGVALGLVGAFFIGRVMEGFLFGIDAADPLTYGVVGGTFWGICLLASYLPARRIAWVDPVRVLKSE